MNIRRRTCVITAQLSVLLYFMVPAVWASSKQVVFDVPVKVEGFQTTKTPRKISVECDIYRGRDKRPIGRNGSGKDTRPYRGKGSGVHHAYVTVNALAGRSFHKGDTWKCMLYAVPAMDKYRSKRFVGGRL